MRRSQQEDQQKKTPSGRRQLPMSSRSNKGKRKAPPAAAPAVAAASNKKGKQARASPATVASIAGKKPRNFGTIEDQLLCRAYVNVSCNPIRGTDQKRTAFWETVKIKYEELYVSEGVVEDYPKEERDWEALANRYQKKIQPEMNLFMPFLKRVYECPPSGVPKEEWPNHAADNFHDHYARHFKFAHCVSILSQLPKFDPESGVDPDTVIEVDDVEDGDKKPSAANKIGNPMGANMARPIGQKAAKKALAAKPEAEARWSVLTAMADSHRQIANMTTVQTNMELLVNEFKMYQSLGMNNEAQVALAALKELRQQSATGTNNLLPVRVAASAASVSTSPPVRNVLLPSGNNEEEVEILEEDLPGEFDDGDQPAAI
jgi:hypothetical protein